MLEENSVTPCQEHLSFLICSFIDCIDAYKDIKNPDEWESCIRCGLKPKVWVFDNGRDTACRCFENKYKHWAIYAESIGSFYDRKRMVFQTTGAEIEAEYDDDELRKNWNHYNKTGEIIFERPKGGRQDGRW